MEQTGKTVYEALEKRADYAIRSMSRSLVYQTYGECLMADELGAITHEEFMALNHKLVYETMNNGRVWNTFHC